VESVRSPGLHDRDVAGYRMSFQPRKADLVRMVSLDPHLVAIYQALLVTMPVALVCAHRGEAEQHEAFLSGASKRDWPNSKHNSVPSRAMDLAPLPLLYKAPTFDWGFMAGVIWRAAEDLGIPIIGGWDWNRNLTSSDEHFADLAHVELA